jgi:hypothetical protein
MAKENNILEEAIIQMKNLEEAVAQNAKGILASTMKQEIKELVKESLNEQDDEEIEDDEEVDMEDSDVADVEFPDDEEEEEYEEDEEEEEYSNDESMMSSLDNEDDTLDLTNMDTDSVVKIFGLLDANTDIEVVPDQQKGNVHFKDNRTNKEYIVVTESDEDMGMYSEEEMYEENMDMMEMDSDEMMGMYSEEEMYEEDMDMMEMDFDNEEDEIVYEIEMDDEMGDGFYDEEEFVTEAKKSTKPKGMGMGSASKFKYGSKPNMSGGFKENMKQGTKGVGMGKGPKKDIYKSDSPSFDGEFSKKPTKSKETKGSMMMKPKKMETKEAARTYGNGSKSGRGLRKGITPNRNLTFESVDSQELELLREKNEEYRKALNVFRTKLNEVAIFNSNLAYATRLFTEHSTSKQEKINILQRFDGVETLKESKNLYKTIKDELSTVQSQPMNESIERKIESAPATGSAVNLIESKTYENPQFLRMKDLMAKLK